MRIKIGIQGGRGSFNEEALLQNYALKTNTAFTIHYFHTTKDVIGALKSKNIDRAQFAIHNTIGGAVEESSDAMRDPSLVVCDEYSLRIQHALIAHPQANLNRIHTIMTHPQVLIQCKKNLAQRFPHLKQMSGQSELIDHAKVAEYISAKKLPKELATIGSTRLAEIYSLQIIENNLQDSDDNFTHFLLVRC